MNNISWWNWGDAACQQNGVTCHAMLIPIFKSSIAISRLKMFLKNLSHIVLLSAPFTQLNADLYKSALIFWTTIKVNGKQIWTLSVLCHFSWILLMYPRHHNLRNKTIWNTSTWTRYLLATIAICWCKAAVHIISHTLTSGFPITAESRHQRKTQALSGGHSFKITTNALQNISFVR